MSKLRSKRIEAGLSMTQLACRAGLAQSMLSDFELGKRQPWPKAKAALAKALRVPESELFPEIKEDR
jgi:transcriptional regulator with XRE-family HTH domain